MNLVILQFKGLFDVIIQNIVGKGLTAKNIQTKLPTLGKGMHRDMGKINNSERSKTWVFWYSDHTNRTQNNGHTTKTSDTFYSLLNKGLISK